MPFPAPSDPRFASMFKGWNRLEARSRSDDFCAGLRAAVADPLWLLARQWQMLELTGENAGSPIRTNVSYEVASLARIQLGDAPFVDVGATPVEVLVERETIEWDWRMRVRAGQHGERLVRAHSPNAQTLIDDLRRLCPLVKPAATDEAWTNLDYTTRRFVKLMAGRVIDGEKLLALARAESPAVPADLARMMSEWYASLYSQGDEGMASPAWRSKRLDYEFSLRGAGSARGRLHARSYRNGAVDWHSFVAEKSAARFTEKANARPTPVHVAYAGQPKRRWWEFEDAAVNFGALDTSLTDIGKLLLAGFALAQGDDWFVVPLSVDANSLVRLREVRVLDCFGVVTAVPQARSAAADPLHPWRVYSLTADDSDSLYVPPSTGVREESPVVEEVQFARDEDANIVFGIEHVVPNSLGEPTGGHAAHLEAQRRWRESLDVKGEACVAVTETPPPASEAAELAEPALPPPPAIRYVMSTRIPGNWIPFVVAESADNPGAGARSIDLCRASIVSTEPADGSRFVSPLSRLLTVKGASALDHLDEEAVGRAGVRVELRRQRMRSATGETFVWLGRTVKVGRGQARSGLRFDAVKAGVPT